MTKDIRNIKYEHKKVIYSSFIHLFLTPDPDTLVVRVPVQVLDGGQRDQGQMGNQPTTPEQTVQGDQEQGNRDKFLLLNLISCRLNGFLL